MAKRHNSSPPSRDMRSLHSARLTRGSCPSISLITVCCLLTIKGIFITPVQGKACHCVFV